MTNKEAKEIYKTLNNIYCGVLANYPDVQNGFNRILRLFLLYKSTLLVSLILSRLMINAIYHSHCPQKNVKNRKIIRKNIEN